jgi:hypothetical protein
MIECEGRIRYLGVTIEGNLVLNRAVIRKWDGATALPLFASRDSMTLLLHVSSSVAQKGDFSLLFAVRCRGLSQGRNAACN